MPYDLRKFSKGYKVCKKNGKKCFSKKPLPKARAEAQMKAIHANTNESLDTNAVGGKLTFAKVQKDNRGYFAKVEYTIADHEGSRLDLYYKLGQNPDYKFFQIDGRTFEDPHDHETVEALNHFGLSGDDIEMAGQDGYDKIAGNE
jgi:hypothetical protein